MPPPLSDLELGRRARARQRAVVGVRLPKDLVEVILTRAERLGISRGRVIVDLVRSALAKEARR